MRISSQVLFTERILPNEGAIIAAEPIPEIIANASLLRQPGGCFKFAGIGMKTEIASTDIQRLLEFSAGDQPADQSIRAVKPIIQSERKAVHPRLVIIRREAGKELLHLIRFAVAIGVPRKKNVRRGADQCAPFPT